MQWYFPLWSKWEYCFTVWARLRVREADMGANNNQTVWALTGPGAAVMMTGRVLLSYFTGSVTYTLTGNRSNSEIAESPRSKFVDKIFVFLSQAEIRTQQFKLNKLLHRPHNVIYYYIYLMTWSWFKYLGSFVMHGVNWSESSRCHLTGGHGTILYEGKYRVGR